ncbi:MAG: hypothetical protein H8D23_39245, partial [Candidatus Brocadiales bacterium]|nr:hypothetical protein [Candidatus Brocadiales bacterium]
IISRGKDYEFHSLFYFKAVHEIDNEAELERIIKKDDHFVSSYLIPDYLENKFSRYKQGGNVNLRWRDYDLGELSIEIVEFFPFGYNKQEIYRGCGSFLLSKTLTAVYEDSKKTDTPFRENDLIYAKRIKTGLLQILKRRGFQEDCDTRKGTYYNLIKDAYLLSSAREEEKIIQNLISARH